ncbi:MAG: aminotransferase class I/II-fold pyridoxal phosphate-dependent enzyme [Clostridiales Family XIII bacterium]|jgi:histidinol-phosphate aminotransferase|nr:aminotransferase class I/II-fold pyridoxal phosphate-dependent enzyme [Clostridiales Family XIII bacterium]
MPTENIKRNGASRSWRDNLIDIEPYVAGEQKRSPRLVKLNTNESPFPPSPLVSKAIEGFDAEILARYPDPNAKGLVRTIAGREGLPEEMVFVGNGSDEVIAFAFKAFFNSGLPVLFPDLTYSFYPVWCRLHGIPYEQVPLNSDFRIGQEGYARGNGGIVIPNPNAPTGIAEGAEFFGRLLRANTDSVVIVDEAYYGFGAETILPLTRKYDNLFVARTLSKAGSLAGLRLGMGFGSPPLIAALNAVKDSFNSYTVGSFTQCAGAAALSDQAYYDDAAAKIIGTRERFTAAMRGLGFSVLDSSANFVFVTHPQLGAMELYEWLKARDILVRWFASPAKASSHLRITIGLDSEMDALLAAIEEYMQGKEI